MDRTVSKDVHFEYYITQLINHGFSYDEIQLNRLLSECIGDFGMATTYKEVIYPLLVRLGLMWRRDQFCPSQEHFLTSVIRQKIFSAINSLPLNSSPAPSWLLFLPEDENHEIGLLFANYLLRLKGHSVIYLGPRVPISAVKHAIVKNQSNNILLFMINRRPITEADSYLAELSGCFQNTRVYLAGNAKFIGELELNQNVNWLRSLQEFEQVINSVDDAN